MHFQRQEPEPPDKSLRAKSSRHPASARRKRQRPARPRTSSPVSAHEPARTCWKEKPPDIFLYDENCNAVENNLNKTDPIEDLFSLVDNFKFFPNNCQQQQASVTNCHTYSNCIINSGIIESNVHKSLIPSVLAPELSMLDINATNK